MKEQVPGGGGKIPVEDIIRETAEQLSGVYRHEATPEIILDSVQTLSVSESFFRKIFLEIIDNAYKFSPSDSKISIRGVNEEGEYKITVSDLGCGMDQEQIDQIGAFVQFDRDRKEQQGHGLGLAIALKMVDISGGKLQIISQPGEGTDVVVTFGIN